MRIWIIAGSVAAALIGSAGSGYMAATWKCTSKENAFKAALVEAEKKRDKISYDAGLDFQKDKSNEQTIFVEVEKVVERIIRKDFYRDDCFDSDGVQVINDAVGGRIPASGTSGTMSSTTPTK
jgi:hypothetical protein